MTFTTRFFTLAFATLFLFSSLAAAVPSFEEGYTVLAIRATCAAGCHSAGSSNPRALHACVEKCLAPSSGRGRSGRSNVKKAVSSTQRRSLDLDNFLEIRSLGSCTQACRSSDTPDIRGCIVRCHAAFGSQSSAGGGESKVPKTAGAKSPKRGGQRLERRAPFRGRKCGTVSPSKAKRAVVGARGLERRGRPSQSRDVNPTLMSKQVFSRALRGPQKICFGYNC
ncbi:hypothetical protein BKA70DRAFT_1574359 [Coprinopsis sp. MPI-PUGE-AT-0042]|nr:hypothetical protein BKA70DRAFT_1574359 [Coprinopsis sp. MPI-PUGE-AT-0042]